MPTTTTATRATNRSRVTVFALAAVLAAALAATSIVTSREGQGPSDFFEMLTLGGIGASSTVDLGDGMLLDRLEHADLVFAGTLVGVSDAGAGGPIAFSALELSVDEVLGGRRSSEAPATIRIEVPRSPITSIEAVQAAAPIGVRMVVTVMRTQDGSWAYTDDLGLLFEGTDELLRDAAQHVAEPEIGVATIAEAIAEATP